MSGASSDTDGLSAYAYGEPDLHGSGCPVMLSGSRRPKSKHPLLGRVLHSKASASGQAGEPSPQPPFDFAQDRLSQRAHGRGNRGRPPEHPDGGGAPAPPLRIEGYAATKGCL